MYLFKIHKRNYIFKEFLITNLIIVYLKVQEQKKTERKNLAFFEKLTSNSNILKFVKQSAYLREVSSILV